MTENKTPKFDYWMVGILRESVKTEIKRASSQLPADYVNAERMGRNKYNPLGQLQLILDRIQELQTHYDNEMEAGLRAGLEKERARKKQ